MEASLSANQRSALSDGILAMLLAAVICTAGALVIGVNLGLFFWGMVLATIGVPWVASTGRIGLRQVFTAAGVTDGIALVWLAVCLWDGRVGLLAWFWSYLLLLSLAALLIGIAWPATKVRLGYPLAAIVGLLWLSCPVWLMHHLPMAWMQRIIDVHPLFVLNSVTKLGVWTESPIAYRLMNLNQDVYYAMPSTPLWGIAFHGLIGGCLIWINAARR